MAMNYPEISIGNNNNNKHNAVSFPMRTNSSIGISYRQTLGSDPSFYGTKCYQTLQHLSLQRSQPTTHRFDRLDCVNRCSLVAAPAADDADLPYS